MQLRPDKKSQRQREAIERNEAWRSLSPKEQIQSLNERKGNSMKQRTKILEKAEADVSRT